MARGASGVWLRAVCRLGLLCRGTVYLLVGYLALAAHGRAGAPASSAGAVQAAGGGGRVPLVVLVAGLGAYALTQLIEAVFRPAHATGSMGAWRQRAVSSWGCLLYAAFCLSTARLAVQAQTAQTAQSEQRQDTGITAELLRTGWGRAVLILAGVLAVAAGWRRAAGQSGSTSGSGSPQRTCPGRWPSSPGRSARWAASRAPSCSCWSASSC